jgi:hypothetical protein
MNTQEIVNVSVSLTAVPASQANFSVPLLLVDHADVPIDRRYRTVTKSSYATALTAATEQVGWCGALWSQNYNPALAYIGRWVSAASSPYCVCVGFETTIATWALVSDGSLTVTTTAGADAITACDFTAPVTTLAQVAAVIDAKLVAGGVSGARCTVDALDRIIFTDAGVTGAGANTVVLSGGGGGTDLYAAAYLNGASSFQQAGLDIEAMGTAVSAILAKTNTPYIICQRGGSIAQVVALSTAVNAMDKILLLVDDDADAKDGTSTADFGYQIEALGHQKTHMTYTEHTVNNGAAATQYPDAAICGEIMPRPEGSASFALNGFSGLSESGLDSDKTTVVPLTSDERIALEAKGYDYLINPAGVVHLRHGLAAGGNEMRVRIGMAYLAAKVAEDYYVYMLAQPVVTYSNEDITAMKSIVQFYADILVDRKLLSEDYTITMPDQSTFTAAVKATHTMTLSNILDAPVMNSVNDVVATLAFTV